MIPYILAVVGGYLIGTSKNKKFDDGGIADGLLYYKWSKQKEYDSMLKRGRTIKDFEEDYPDLYSELYDNGVDFGQKGFYKSHLTIDQTENGVIVASNSQEALEISRLADKKWYGFEFFFEDGELKEIQ